MAPPLLFLPSRSHPLLENLSLPLSFLTPGGSALFPGTKYTPFCSFWSFTSLFFYRCRAATGPSLHFSIFSLPFFYCMTGTACSLFDPSWVPQGGFSFFFPVLSEPWGRAGVPPSPPFFLFFRDEPAGFRFSTNICARDTDKALSSFCFPPTSFFIPAAVLQGIAVSDGQIRAYRTFRLFLSPFVFCLFRAFFSVAR